MNLIAKLAYYSVGGFPFFVIFGILAFVGFCFTALISYLNVRGIHVIPFKWHPRLAVTSLILAVIHMLLQIFSR